MAKSPTQADPFDVWGAPPQIILDQLGKQDHDRLRRYIAKVATKTYRIAYDCGSRESEIERLRAFIAKVAQVTDSIGREAAEVLRSADAPSAPQEK